MLPHWARTGPVPHVLGNPLVALPPPPPPPGPAGTASRHLLGPEKQQEHKPLLEALVPRRAACISAPRPRSVEGESPQRSSARIGETTCGETQAHPGECRLVANGRFGHELPDFLSTAAGDGGLGSPLQRLLA